MLKNEDDYNSVSDRDNTRETATAAHQDGEKNGAEREMKVQSTTSAKITQKDSGDKAVTKSSSKKRGTDLSKKSLFWSECAPDEVTVEEAGVTEVNGVYKQCFIADKYSKKGLWEGEDVDFVLYRVHGSQLWVISAESAGKRLVFVLEESLQQLESILTRN